MTKRRKAVQRSKKCTGLTYCYDAKHEKAWKSATGAQYAPESASGAQDTPKLASGAESEAGNDGECPPCLGRERNPVWTQKIGPGAPGRSRTKNTPNYHYKFFEYFDGLHGNEENNQFTCLSLQVSCTMAENTFFFSAAVLTGTKSRGSYS